MIILISELYVSGGQKHRTRTAKLRTQCATLDSVRQVINCECLRAPKSEERAKESFPLARSASNSKLARLRKTEKSTLVHQLPLTPLSSVPESSRFFSD